MIPYAEALSIITTEAEMMHRGNRRPETSIRWLKEAIELLEEAERCQ